MINLRWIENMSFMASSQHLKELNYYVTGDPDEADYNQHYSEAIRELLYSTYVEMQKAKPRFLPKLLQLVKKYDRIPAFRNYLSTYYMLRGKKEKGYEVNRQLVKEFPDYLIGKIVLAREYLEKRQFEEIPGYSGRNIYRRQ